MHAGCGEERNQVLQQVGYGGHACRFGIQWTDDEVAAAEVLDRTRTGHRGGDVHDRGHDVLGHLARDGRSVLYAVLQAEDGRVRLERWRQLARDGVGVRRLDAEEDEIRAAHSLQCCTGLGADRLDRTRHVELESIAPNGLHMLLAANQNYTLTRTREHCPIEAADGSGAHNSNLVESGCHSKTMLTGESEGLRAIKLLVLAFRGHLPK